MTYAVIRGLANNTPTKLLAYDTFLQTEGALAGKSAPLGGTWAGAGDTTDFSVIAADDVARRTATEDADIYTGRYAIVGSEEPTTSRASVDTVASTPVTLGASVRGVFLRYSSTSNWVMAWLGIGTSNAVLRVLKRVSGTVTELGVASLPNNYLAEQVSTRRVSLAVSASGTWEAWLHDPSASAASPLITGYDAALATGGSLAKGKGGFYDAQTSFSGITRTFDNFNLLTGEDAGRVLYAGKVGELNDQGYERQDATGTYYGGASQHRGATFYLEPAGQSGAINRIVVALRRNDVVTEPDSHVEDKHSVEVKVRERFLAPR
jgi:hypothetical protein